MNTPVHAIVNLAILGKKSREKYYFSVLLGGVLPDIPIFIFYWWEKFILKVPEQTIWKTDYFLDKHQIVFDLVHSFPVILISMGVVYLLGNYLGIITKNITKWLEILLTSMFLHSVFDLPLHAHDAHRHFFPFSNFRFESPISYWDPANGGQVFFYIEAVVMFVLSIYVYRLSQRRLIRGSVWLLNVFYFGGMLYFMILFH